MKKSKRFLWGFSELDYKAMESYLEDMAGEGWLLRKINGNFATFEQITPKKIHFTVNVLKKKGFFGNENTEGARESRSFYEEEGWRFIDAKGHLQFFFSEKEERPQPVHRDLEGEKRMHATSLWKKQLGQTLYILGLLSLGMYFLYPIGFEDLKSNTGLILVMVLPFILIGALGYLVYLGVLRYRITKSVGKGDVHSSTDYRRVRKKAWIVSGLKVLLALIALAAVVMDLIGGDSIAYMSLFNLVMILVFLQLVKTLTREKPDKKSQVLLYLALAVGTIVFVIGAYYPRMDFHDQHRDRIPEDYPRLVGEDWEYMKNLEENTPVYFRNESFLLPVSYEANYYLEESAFSYAYHQAVHQRIAGFIYQEILDESGTWGGVSVRGMEELSPDHEFYHLWEVDRIAYHETRSNLLLLKDNKVLRFQGIPDFSDPDFVDEVNRTFF